MNEFLQCPTVDRSFCFSSETEALRQNPLTSFNVFWYRITMNGQTQINHPSLSVRHENTPGEDPAAPGVTRARTAALA